MKRFYKDVTIAEADIGWRILLDGRGIKTAAGQPQIVPTSALATAMAAEWADQADTINPKHFIFRDMADFALDVVTPNPADTVQSIARFAQSDTLCYRADPDEALYQRQWDMWEPYVTAAETRHNVAFKRISGIIHRPQPPATLAKMQAVLAGYSPFTLAALNQLASLSASLILALAALESGADAETLWPETLWNAANLEEDWQVELWGQDQDAAALRASRLSSFAAAMDFAALVR
jgi:chaperone required for assembly of F1-ATPase